MCLGKAYIKMYRFYIHLGMLYQSKGYDDEEE